MEDTKINLIVDNEDQVSINESICSYECNESFAKYYVGFQIVFFSGAVIAILGIILWYAGVF